MPWAGTRKPPASADCVWGESKLRVFIISGICAGIAGMVSLGRFGSVSTQDGSGYELTVIAAAVVGGASLTGGRGTALWGTPGRAHYPPDRKRYLQPPALECPVQSNYHRLRDHRGGPLSTVSASTSEDAGLLESVVEDNRRRKQGENHEPPSIHHLRFRFGSHLSLL